MRLTFFSLVLVTLSVAGGFVLGMSFGDEASDALSLHPSSTGIVEAPPIAPPPATPDVVQPSADAAVIYVDADALDGGE